MDQNFSKKLISRLLIGGAFAAAGIVALVYFYSQSSMGASMSRQGWTALIAGTIVSVLVSVALTSVLVLGRRNGYDDSANEIVWKLSNDD
jgi:hypothetical protein